MGIYIFEPSGAGGTPTLQQVLTAGSTLTTTNTIDLNNTDLSFYNGNSSFGQTNLNFVFNYNLGSPKFYFIDNSASAIQGIYIDPVAISYKFGEFYYGGGCILYEPSLVNKFRIITDNILLMISPNIDINTDSFRFFEATVGSLFKTTANIGTYTPPNKVAGYMAIEINSNVYHIPLYNP